MTFLEKAEATQDGVDETRQIRSVFHPSDFSKADEIAFLHALRIALGARGELQILHVRDQNEWTIWDRFPSAAQVLSRWGYVSPNATVSDVRALGLNVLRYQRAGQDPLPEIERFINEMRPDLSVLATHQRRGIQRIINGSIAEPIPRLCRALTLYVPRRAQGFVDSQTGKVTLKTIMIPSDTEENTQRAFQAAAALVESLGIHNAHFMFLHVGDQKNMPQIQEGLRWAWTSERRVWEGEVVSHIVQAAAAFGTDLISMSTSGHDDIIDAMVGSTTEQVLREVDCPLLVAPTNADAPQKMDADSHV